MTLNLNIYSRDSQLKKLRIDFKNTLKSFILDVKLICYHHAQKSNSNKYWSKQVDIFLNLFKSLQLLT